MVSRLQFAFTVTYHYLFPMLTMGLALLIFILKSLYMSSGDVLYNKSARFWGKIFAVTFVMGVVTGIPLEFQFGTNWAAFSRFAGDIIAQTLAMEGAFAFFLESAFVGLFLFGEERFGQRVHWFSSLMVFLGTWASGYFIITTNAWVQHPVGYKTLPNGNIELDNYWAVLLNSWTFAQYAHNMGGAVVCGAFVMAGLGAFYVLGRQARGVRAPLPQGRRHGRGAREPLDALPERPLLQRAGRQAPAGLARRYGGALPSRRGGPASSSSASPTWRTRP